MIYVINTEASIEAIADAIRAKTGSSEEMTVAEMPTEIASISGGGVHTVNVNGNNCAQYFKEITEEGFGIFQESGDQNFDEIIEYFAAGYQTVIHLTFSNTTYDCYVFAIYDSDNDPNFDPEEGARFDQPYDWFTNYTSGVLILAAYCKFITSEYDIQEYNVGIMAFGTNGSEIEYAGS